MRSVFAAATLALLLAGCGTFTPHVPLGSAPNMNDNVKAGARMDPEAARQLISSYRRQRGLGAVSLDPKLMAMAQEQAKAMAAENRMSHSLASSGAFTRRLNRSGYGAAHAAENVGAGYDSVAEVLAGWRKSPGHDKNLLLAEARHIGIAAAPAPGTRYKVYWALVLAEPAERPEAAKGERVNRFGPPLPRLFGMSLN